MKLPQQVIWLSKEESIEIVWAFLKFANICKRQMRDM